MSKTVSASEPHGCRKATAQHLLSASPALRDAPKRPEYVFVPERREAPVLLTKSLI